MVDRKLCIEIVQYTIKKLNKENNPLYDYVVEATLKLNGKEYKTKVVLLASNDEEFNEEYALHLCIEKAILQYSNLNQNSITNIVNKA